MPDPWWLEGCLKNIKKIPGAVLCSEQECRNAAIYFHAICTCQPPYTNGCSPTWKPGCCAYGPTSPIVIFASGEACYCCCGGVASMAVAIDDTTFKPIGDILVGDTILVAAKPDLTAWEPAPVAFSSGTGPGSDSPTLQVRFGDESKPEFVIVSSGQLFLVAGGKLKQASRLVAGKDELIRADGSPAKVVGLSGGATADSLHRIATSTGPATSLAGHLMIANGVVCGDFALQLGNLEETAPDLLVAGHAELPTFGSEAYATRYGTGPRNRPN